MKNQYFGDVHDYRKYGMLRCLQATGLRLGVCWMLTPNDGRTDGRHLRYLHQPKQFRGFDPPLFDELREACAGTRQVATIERSALFSGTRFSPGTLLPPAAAREEYFANAQSALRQADLVFFDPDNGLEVPSVRRGTASSPRYLYWSELDAFWAAGASLLIYQHYRRESRPEMTTRLLGELKARVGAPAVTSLSTAHVVFLLATQSAHRPAVEAGLSNITKSWPGQIECGPR